MTKSNQLGFSTRCVHAGQEPDPTTGAVMMPIYTTSTYVQQSPGVHAARGEVELVRFCHYGVIRK